MSNDSLGANGFGGGEGSLQVNINTATELELQSLTGISPAMVRAWTPLLTVHDPTGPVPPR